MPLLSSPGRSLPNITGRDKERHGFLQVAVYATLDHVYRIKLAHLVTYLAEAPRSTRAEVLARADPSARVSLAVRNASTRLMGALGYDRGYRYNPDYA